MNYELTNNLTEEGILFKVKTALGTNYTFGKNHFEANLNCPIYLGKFKTSVKFNRNLNVDSLDSIVNYLENYVKDAKLKYIKDNKNLYRLLADVIDKFITRIINLKANQSSNMTSLNQPQEFDEFHYSIFSCISVLI